MNSIQVVKKQPKLLEQVRSACRVRHYSLRTETTYEYWIRQYIYFHKKTHPENVGINGIPVFLSFLAEQRNVAASTQNLALNALVFLYREVLGIPTDGLPDWVRVKRPAKLPVVLTAFEAKRIIHHMPEEVQLPSSLMFGSGLRLMESVRLRVKDIDFDNQVIIVRDGKGARDRTTLLPKSLIEPLKMHLKARQKIHEFDLAKNQGSVYLPFALDKKYPNGINEFTWQYVFPADRISKDPRSGRKRKHHFNEQRIQRAMKKALADLNINKAASPHSFRHTFATELLKQNYDIRTVQVLMGHKDVRTTQIYTHVLGSQFSNVVSPMDVCT